MGIDIGVAATILCFGLIGIASGFWGQILRLIALASLYFIAPPVAQLIEGPVGGIFAGNAELTEQAQEVIARGLSLVVAAIGLYIIMSIIIGVALRAARRGRPISGTSRALGFILGLAKGGALSYLLLAGLVVVAQSQHYSAALAENDIWVKQASQSKLVELVSEHNLITFELPPPEELIDVDEYLTEEQQRALEEYEAASEAAAQAPPAVGQTPPPPDAQAPSTPTPAQGPPAPGAVDPATGQAQPK